jgi:hypothetical protein
MLYGTGNQMNTVQGYTNYPNAYSTYNGNQDSFAATSPFKRGMFFVQGQRKRMNIVAILLSLFVPWLLFCFVDAVLSFSIHYKQPYFAYILVLLSFLVVVGLSSIFAASAVTKKFSDPTYQPSWYIFIAVTSALAFTLGLFGGEWNYGTHMLPYYDLLNLARYTDIDTNMYLGQQLMDAGQIEFKTGTALDLGRSMGFKNHDVYCVAPIMTKGGGAPSVDFWAVGKNCCSGVSADFHCKGFSDPTASGVIRLMRDADRPFYRLAVQQAEATYKMTANHPLFFEWVHSATEATDTFRHNGYINYILGISAYFLLQGFLTAVTALAFSKLVHA